MKRVTQTIERTLLLTWIQRIMMQLILRYKRKGFSVFRSVGSWRYHTKYLHGGITWITDLIVHTNRPLMSSYKPPSPWYTLSCLIVGVGVIAGVGWWNCLNLQKGWVVFISQTIIKWSLIKWNEWQNLSKNFI